MAIQIAPPPFDPTSPDFIVHNQWRRAKELGLDATAPWGINADSEFVTGEREETSATGGGFTPITRATTTVTTASLGANATQTGTVDVAKSFRLLRVGTDRPARVRLYATAAQREADAARAVGASPDGDHGVILDIVTTSALLAFTMSPQVDGSNLEAAPSAAIAYAVTNLDATAGAVAVTLTYLRSE